MAILTAIPAAAQAPVGTVAGFVRDPTRPVVRGASVTVTSVSTGAARMTTTDDQGFFQVPTLKPGDYAVKVTSPGFADFVAPAVAVEVGQTARVDASLRVAVVSDTVQVTAQ